MNWPECIVACAGIVATLLLFIIIGFGEDILRMWEKNNNEKKL